MGFSYLKIYKNAIKIVIRLCVLILFVKMILANRKNPPLFTVTLKI
jgi:hypothetical protein